MSYYDPYGKKFGKNRQTIPGSGSRGTFNRTASRAQSKLFEDDLQGSLCVAPVKSRSEFDGTIAQRASSNKSVNKTFSFRGKVHTVDPNLEVHSSDIINLAKQVLDSAERYNDKTQQKYQYKNQRPQRSNHSLYDDERARLESDMFCFESGFRDTVDRMDSVKSQLRDGVNRVMTAASGGAARASSSRANATSRDLIDSCSYHSDYRKNFTDRARYIDDLDLDDIEQPKRSILKFPVPQLKPKRSVQEDESEVSLRYLDYDSFTEPNPARKNRIIHKPVNRSNTATTSTSPRKSAGGSATKKSSQKPSVSGKLANKGGIGYGHFGKQNDGLDESLRKADEKIKELKSKKKLYHPRGKMPATRAAAAKIVRDMEEHMDTVRSQQSLQCGSQKSVTFSDSISDTATTESPRSLGISPTLNKKDLKYSFDKITAKTPTATGKANARRKNRENIVEVQKIVERLGSTTGTALPSRSAIRGRGRIPSPDLSSSDNSDFTAQSDEDTKPTPCQSTQTITGTEGKNSFLYDATKSQYLVKQLEHQTRDLPLANIDDLLGLKPDDHGKYLSKLKCKYPRFFLTKKEDRLLSDIKLKSRMSDLDDIEAESIAAAMQIVEEPGRFASMSTAIGRAMQASSSHHLSGQAPNHPHASGVYKFK